MEVPNAGIDCENMEKKNIMPLHLGTFILENS